MAASEPFDDEAMLEGLQKGEVFFASIDSIEAFVDPLAELIKSLVGPALSHGLHAARLQSDTQRIVYRCRSFDSASAPVTRNPAIRMPSSRADQHQPPDRSHQRPRQQGQRNDRSRRDHDDHDPTKDSLLGNLHLFPVVSCTAAKTKPGKDAGSEVRGAHFSA